MNTVIFDEFLDFPEMPKLIIARDASKSLDPAELYYMLKERERMYSIKLKQHSKYIKNQKFRKDHVVWQNSLGKIK